MSIIVGTDPEFGIIDKKTGRPVPAFRFFPGKDAKLYATSGDLRNYTSLEHGKLADEKIRTIKPEPRDKFDGSQNISGTGHHALFRDGYMLEVNVPATTCRGLQLNDVKMALWHAQQRLGDNYALITVPSIEVDLKDLADAPDDSRTFGCDPAASAYNGGKLSSAVIDAMTHPLRYAGGHLHFSCHESSSSQGFYGAGYKAMLDEKLQPFLVRLFDVFIGVPFSVIFDRPEQYLRRKYYGKAGEYRRQKYSGGYAGVEYRVLGPEIFNEAGLYAAAVGAGRWIINNFETLHKEFTPVYDTIAADVQAAINEGKGGVELVQKLVRTVPGFYDTATVKELASKKLFNFNFFNDMVEGHDNWPELPGRLGINVPYGARSAAV